MIEALTVLPCMTADVVGGHPKCDVEEPDGALSTFSTGGSVIREGLSTFPPVLEVLALPHHKKEKVDRRNSAYERPDEYRARNSSALKSRTGYS